MREARDRAELLLREVNHRVANSLALVAALTSMQRAQVSEPSARQALRRHAARILAIAGVHKRLYTSQNVETVEIGAYLEGLIEELKGSMLALGRDHDIVLDTNAVSLPTDKAVSLGIIVTELVTNAYKYAYKQHMRGDIRVRMVRDGEYGSFPSRMTGVGYSRENTVSKSGLGTVVISAMSGKLGAEISYPETSGGTKVVLRFAL